MRKIWVDLKTVSHAARNFGSSTSSNSWKWKVPKYSGLEVSWDLEIIPSCNGVQGEIASTSLFCIPNACMTVFLCRCCTAVIACLALMIESGSCNFELLREARCLARRVMDESIRKCKKPTLRCHNSTYFSLLDKLRRCLAQRS